MPLSVRNLSVALALSVSVCFPVSSQAQGLAGSYLAARQASILNDFQAAADYYVRAITRDQRNPMLLENAVVALANLGQIDRAVPVARQMQSVEVDSQIGQMILLAEQLEKENYQQAIDDIEAGRSVGPLVDGLVTAWNLLALGKMDEALAKFDESTTQTGLQAFGLYHKALALATKGEFAAAEAVLSGQEEEPLRLTRRGLYAHAQVLSQLGRNDDAVELITGLFGNDLDPGLEALLAALDAGETVPFTFVNSGKEGLAEVFYTVAGALNGEASDGYTLLYSRIAEYLRPDHTDAILLSAALLESQSQYELATIAYDRVSRDDPAFHVAEMGRAEAMRRSDNIEGATEVMRQLSETHADLAVVHVAHGDLLRQQERYDDASKSYDLAVALFEEDNEGQWIVYYARGISNEREDRWPLAERDFRKALELRPDQPQVLNYLGYSFVEMQINLEEALAMIERAVAARPDSGYITDSLGWVLYRMGKYEDAVGFMERAAELMPVDPIVNDHLGDVYWAVGRKIEAEFQWKRALSFDPEEDEANRIRRKLEVGLDVVLDEEGAEPLAVASDEG